MKKQLFTIVVLFLCGMFLVPVDVLGAHDTVTFDAATDLYFWGVPATVSVSSGGEVAGFTINSASLDLDMESGSTITLTSTDKKIMTSNLGTKASCGTDSSVLSVSSGSTQGISIDISVNTCPSGSAVVSTGGTGGGGGGSSAEPATPQVLATTTVKTTTTTATAKPVSQMTTAELQAKVAELTQLIVQLQAQLVAMLGGAQTGGVSSAGGLTSDLKFGQTSEAVRLLQTWLAKDSEVYPEGKITGYFGALTKVAVKKFQEKYASEVLSPTGLTSGTGMVGAYTRAKLNSLYGK